MNTYIPENLDQITQDAPVQPLKRSWPPILIGDILGGEPFEVMHVEPYAPLHSVMDFLFREDANMIAVKSAVELSILFADDIAEHVSAGGKDALEDAFWMLPLEHNRTCSISDSPCVVLAAMNDLDCDRMAVTDHGRIVGVITRRDLTQA